MTTPEELAAALDRAEAAAHRAELRLAIHQNAPILKDANARQTLNRERLAAANREHEAQERADLAASLAKVKAQLAEQSAWRRRQTSGRYLAQFDSAEKASAIREVED